MAFAKYKFIEAETVNNVSGMVENTVKIGDNAGYRHFLLFHNVFISNLLKGLLNLALSDKRLKLA